MKNKQTNVTLTSRLKPVGNLVGILIASQSISVFAAGNGADLKLSITAPSNEMVNVAQLYTVRVSNIGNRDATLAKLEINLPVTHTSPQIYLLGQVTQMDSRCSLAVGKMTCPLNVLRKGRSTDVTFSYLMPVSKNPIIINGMGSSATNDLNPNNNSLQYSPALKFPAFSVADHIVSGTIEAANSHCTGQGLISYFECELFPSSISGHVATFNSDGTISFAGEPSYGGSWQQSNTVTQQLSFQYTENGSVVASFSGYGSIPNCFDGVTTFPNSIYVSPYRVCF